RAWAHSVAMRSAVSKTSREKKPLWRNCRIWAPASRISAAARAGSSEARTQASLSRIGKKRGRSTSAGCGKYFLRRGLSALRVANDAIGADQVHGALGHDQALGVVCGSGLLAFVDQDRERKRKLVSEFDVAGRLGRVDAEDHGVLLLHRG